MKITISDHETHTGPKSDKDIPFRWWVSFTVGNEAAFNFSRQLVCSFSEFAEHLVAKGEFDGYDDSTPDGSMWTHRDERYYSPDWDGGYIRKYRAYSYDEVIREFLLTRDLEPALAEFVAIKLSEAEVVEDLLLKTEAA